MVQRLNIWKGLAILTIFSTMAAAGVNTTFIDSVEFREGTYTRKMKEQNDTVYTLVGDYFKTIDVSSPSNISVEFSGLLTNPGTDLAVSGNYGYLTVSDFNTYDISNSTNPSNITSISTNIGRSWATKIDGNKVYVGNFNGLGIIDISSPESPVEEGICEISSDVRDIAIKSDTAYLATPTGLMLVNISNSTNPTKIDSFVTSSSSFGWSGEVTLKGDTAFFADGDAGLRVLDISNSSNITEITSFSMNSTNAVVLKNDFAFVANGSNGVNILDISNINNISQIGSYSLPSYNGANDILSINDKIYVANKNTSLEAFYILRNESPLAVDDNATTDEDTDTDINVLSNDYDANGDAISVSSINSPANGSVTNNNDGTITYSPDQNYNGEDSFTYTISDGGGHTETATVTVTVNPVNDAPVASDDNATTDEDNYVTIDVLSNDSDVEGDELSVSGTTTPSNGSVSNNNDGTVTYTPATDYNGNDSFDYTVSDGNGGSSTATVSITINPVNDAPTFTKGSDQTVDEDAGSQTVSGWATNISPGPSNESSQTVSFNISNDNNDLFNSQPNVDPSSGDLTYTPAADSNGSATVTISLSDDGGTSNGGTDTSTDKTFTITVNAVNDAPVASNDNATIDEDNSVTIDVLSNDSDVEGDELSVSGTTTPSNGTITNNNDGTITYTPASDYNGDDSFDYTVSDGNGGSNTATVSITVNPVNNAPTSGENSITIKEDESYNFSKSDFPYRDSDGDEFAGIELVTDETNGDLEYGGTDVVTDKLYTDVSKLVFTPGENENGQEYANFNFKVNDSHGMYSRKYYTLWINVEDVNDPPQFTTEIPETNFDENETIELNISASDPESNDLVYSLESLLESPDGETNLLDEFSEISFDSLSGEFSWPENYDRAGQYELIYSVTDGQIVVYDTSAIKISDVNRKPEFTQTLSDTSIKNDSEFQFTFEAKDPDEDEITFGLKDSIDGLTLSEEGALTWKPVRDPKDSYQLEIYATDGTDTVTTSTNVEVEDVVSISRVGTSIPDDYSLENNYPNPFNPTTTIKYGLPQSSRVKISVYNINGNLIETILHSEKEAGIHKAVWDASGLPSGVYFYRIQAGNFTTVKKCMLLK